MLSVSEALSYDRDAIGIGRKGTIDKPFVLKAPFWTVDTLFYAVPEHPECLDFIHDVFQIIDWKKKDESTGVPSLSKEAINDTNVMVPKIDEQIIIGGFFTRIDALITLHQCKQNHKKEALMSYTLTKYEKETVLLYNQSHDPITISTYDPGLRRRLREFAARYPEMCWRVDKQKYPDYAEYEIKKDRVSIRLLPPMSEEKRRVASEKAKSAGLGTKGNA